MINKLKPLKKKGYQNTGAVSSQDSVRHQFGKTLKYEATRGAADGSGLSNFGNPNLPPGATEKQANDWMMQNIYPKLGSFPTAMEKGEAGDFMYNSGKDLRPYAIQEYLRQQDPQNKRGWQDTDGKYKDRKDPSKWDSYWSEVQKLPLNQRRVLGNKGRDWYYKNINNKPDGSPDDAYKNTWYGRIWNTNDYNEFDPNNPKFTPKFQDAGNAAQLGKLDPNAQALNDQYYTTPAAGIRKYNTGLNQTVSGLVGVMGNQIYKAAKAAAAVATGGASTMATGMASKAAMGILSAPNAPAPTMQGTTAPLNPNGDQAFGTRGIVPKPQPSHGKDAWQQSQLPGEQYNPPRTPTTPVASIGTLGTMGRTVKSQPETLDGYDELQKWKNENGGFNSTDVSKQDVPRASTEGSTTVHSNKEGTAKMDWSKSMKQGAIGMGIAGIQYGLAKAADNMEPALDPNLMRPGQNNMWKNVQAAETGGNIRQRKYSFQDAGNGNLEGQIYDEAKAAKNFQTDWMRNRVVDDPTGNALLNADRGKMISRIQGAPLPKLNNNSPDPLLSPNGWVQGTYKPSEQSVNIARGSEPGVAQHEYTHYVDDISTKLNDYNNKIIQRNTWAYPELVGKDPSMVENYDYLKEDLHARINATRMGMRLQPKQKVKAEWIKEYYKQTGDRQTEQILNMARDNKSLENLFNKSVSAGKKSKNNVA